MNHGSPLNSEAKSPRPWLQVHYEARRKRTVDLVKAAVDRLKREKQAVTIEAICRLSKDLDPQGKGIKKAGVLGNAEAHAYYQKHSASYQIAQGRRRPSLRRLTTNTKPLRIDPSRDVNRVRRRYLQQNKAELVERLLTVEQAYAQTQQQLTILQFELIEISQKLEEAGKQKQRGHKQNMEGESNKGISTERK